MIRKAANPSEPRIKSRSFMHEKKPHFCGRSLVGSLCVSFNPSLVGCTRTCPGKIWLWSFFLDNSSRKCVETRFDFGKERLTLLQSGIKFVLRWLIPRDEKLGWRPCAGKARVVAHEVNPFATGTEQLHEHLWFVLFWHNSRGHALQMNICAVRALNFE